MEWWEIAFIIFGGVTVLLASGMPVAFCFILVNILGVLFLQGGGRAFHQMILCMYSSVSTFVLLPITLFVLMGEVLWHSKMAFHAIDVIDKMLGRVPARLSILTVASGTVFSSLSGSTIANTAMLGTILLPELQSRGYKNQMAIGPILASGGLAMMIPPSNLAVILAALGKISVGRILIGAIIPGLIMAILYLGYIIVRCKFQPHLAPIYQKEERISLSEKVISFIKYLLPLSLIVFLVTGLIIFGIASPTESAALGCLGSFILAACYKRLTWEVLKKSIQGSLHITIMMLTIMIGSFGFSQLLAYSGVSRGLLEFTINLKIAPILLIIGTQIIIIFLGTFMEQIAIMMITLPILIPLVKALGYDLIWFGILMLVNLEISLTSPPFGILNFVMKGVAPAGTTMRDIYLSGLPFIMCDLAAMSLIMIFPQTVSWLQSIVFS